MFTNEDDPFGSIKGATKFDLIRTTLQRAKVGALVFTCLIVVGFGCGSMLAENYLFLFSRMLKISAFQLNFYHWVPLMSSLISLFSMLYVYLYSWYHKDVNDIMLIILPTGWIFWILGFDWTRRGWSCSIFAFSRR